MRAPTLRLVTDRFPNDYEIEVDNFAGGGGASLGLELALGRSPAVAINHDPEALAMHRANHPDCEHYCEDVFDVDPLAVCRGRKVGLAWFSPDCKHHSKAKGGAPVRSKKIRGLAWVVRDWARIVRPRIICLENVEEFIKWGPLDKKGHIIKRRAGEEFAEWWACFERLGYKGELKILRACDYGAPTSRKRLFVIFRCDGEPIVWPEPTHGPGRAHPYRTAAECIDFSLPCPSIFLTPEEAKIANVRRPLADKTLRRIARGMKKYVFGAKRPFIVPVSHGDKGKTDTRCHDLNEPARTITGANRGELALVQPFVSSFYGESHKGEARARGIDHPLPTQTTANRFAVIAPYIAGVGGRQGLSIERSVDRPYQTITTKADSVVVAPVLVRTAHGEVDKTGKRRGKGAHNPEDPLPTICASSVDFAVAAATLIQTGYGERPGQAPRCLDIEAPIGTVISGGSGGNGKHALVTAFFAKHFGDRPGGGWAGGASAEAPFGTVTTQDHHALVTSNIIKLRGTSDAHMDASSLSPEDPAPTISAGGWHLGEVRAFLTKYNGVGENVEDLRDPLDTVTTRDRFNLVTVDGSDYQVVDIGMRMLTPRELFRAQGFPDVRAMIYGQGWDDHLSPGKPEPAPSADLCSSQGSDHVSNLRAVVRVQIDCVRRVLALHSQRRSSDDAAPAEWSGSYPLPTEVVVSARALARMAPCEARRAHHGAEEQRLQDSASTHLENGSTSATLSEDEMAILADGAKKRYRVAMGAPTSPSITLQDGATFRHCDSTLRILSSYVSDVMALSIPKTISIGNSFDVELEIVDRYIINPVFERTWISKKTGARMSKTAPLSGKAQVKMCGNSVCPPLAAAIVGANYVPQRVEIAAPMELVA